MKYLDRRDAAVQMLKALNQYRDVANGVVLALPRGGVPVARYIADHLHWPLDVAIVKKIKHPFYPEFALGAVSTSGYVINSQGDISGEYIENEVHRLEKVIKEKYLLYRGSKKPVKLNNKTVMLIDDGMATGSSMLAAINLTEKENPKQLVVAIPVASEDAYSKIFNEVDAVFCLQVSSNFQAVSQYYEAFPQVTDEEVITLLQ
ncbi:putative phosphoribosyl transferase [Catalinimonas alkaloidigena]|uniref:phosphoribosyltransferase n=1 Tax=Catalinimonas alkaloidigena TaxID=1075417 RepID=UPI002405EC1C|nr:phosphoribosyltransferase family protein [Catalinimonas alkaloidigena]MDF9797866.1 putative phosphoribosyl transferase [Catalinimonas alkaloidigena]